MFAFLRSFGGQENCSKKSTKGFCSRVLLYPKEKVRNGEFMLVYHLHRQTGLGRPVWANGKQISVLGKFRSGLALTICRNPYHLPKILQDGDG